jgi:hypothetical protein
MTELTGMALNLQRQVQAHPRGGACLAGHGRTGAGSESVGPIRARAAAQPRLGVSRARKGRSAEGMRGEVCNLSSV